MLAYWLEWDWEAAGRSFDRALALNPGDAMAHATRGWFLVTMRRPDEAVREIKTAIELDPLMPLYYAWSVGIHTDVGRCDEALQDFARALELDPNNGLAYFHAARAYALKGLSDEALADTERIEKTLVFPGWTEGMLAYLSSYGDHERS
jgi:tetratricopeptide (TPR) repeat protein